MNLNKGISTPIAIGLIVVVSAVVGVLVWQFKPVPETESEPTEPQATTSEEESTTEQPIDYTTQSACEEADYYWYEDSCHEKEQKDDISIFLEEIEQATGVNFSEIKPVEFTWTTGTDSQKPVQPITTTIQGKSFVAEDVTEETFGATLETYFENKEGFDVSEYNVATGMKGEQWGYVKNQTVCILDEGFEDNPSPEQIQSGEVVRVVEVKCGKK